MKAFILKQRGMNGADCGIAKKPRRSDGDVL